jgi:hypothetical protein
MEGRTPSQALAGEHRFATPTGLVTVFQIDGLDVPRPLTEQVIMVSSCKPASGDDHTQYAPSKSAVGWLPVTRAPAGAGGEPAWDPRRLHTLEVRMEHDYKWWAA